MSTKENNIHAGHRKRLREAIEKTDVYSLNDVNYLEYLLTFVIPRADTNPIAHELLNRFISLDGVFKTSEFELLSVPGIGPKAAKFLHAVGASTFMRNRIGSNVSIKLETLSSIRNFMQRVLPPTRNEQFILINLGKNFTVKNYQVFEGVSHSLVNLDVKKLSDYIFAHQTGFYIFAHTHPEHVAAPSDSDDKLFEKLTVFAETLSIVMIDNLIFSDNDYFSYRFCMHSKYDEFDIDYKKRRKIKLEKKEPENSSLPQSIKSVVSDDNIDF